MHSSVGYQFYKMENDYLVEILILFMCCQQMHNNKEKIKCIYCKIQLISPEHQEQSGIKNELLLQYSQLDIVYHPTPRENSRNKMRDGWNKLCEIISFNSNNYINPILDHTTINGTDARQKICSEIIHLDFIVV